MPFIIRLPSKPIGKLEAARRQLEEAIRMLFEGRDSLAIHTLTAAAHQVLADLGQGQGFGGYVRNKDLIKEGQWAEWKGVIKEAENFLKHADNDPNGQLTLDAKITELFLIDALMLYEFLSKTVPHAFLVYRVWLLSNYPSLFMDGPAKDAIDEFQKTAPLVNLKDKVTMLKLLDLAPQ